MNSAKMGKPSKSIGDQVTSVNDLNNDVLLEIFAYVPIADLTSVGNVCSRWKNLSEVTWKTVKTLKCDGRNWYFSKELNNVKRLKVKTMKKFMKVLKSCHKSIKYFYLYASSDTKFNETISTDLITAVAQHCKNLEIIEIDKGHSLITDGELYALIKNCRDIKRLVLNRMGPINEEYLEALFEYNPNLKHLSLLNGDKMKLSLLENLPSRLEELNLVGINIRNSFIFNLAIKNLNNLRTLQCVCDDITIRAITNKTSLTKLSLLFQNVPSNWISQLSNLVNLVDLDLSYNNCLEDNNLISIIESCTKLEILNISGCNSITDSGIFILTGLPNLRILRMESLDLVTDTPLGYLPDSIEKLFCSGCDQVGDDGLMKLIRRAEKLSNLDVSACGVTNSIVITAARVTDQRVNKNPYRCLLEIDISSTNVNVLIITHNLNLVCREINLISCY